MDAKQQTCKNIAYLRKLHRVSQEKLGMALGFTRSKISSWEEYRSAPNLNDLEKLCEYFIVSMDTIVLTDIEKEYQELSKNNLKSQPKYLWMKRSYPFLFCKHSSLACLDRGGCIRDASCRFENEVLKDSSELLIK